MWSADLLLRFGVFSSLMVTTFGGCQFPKDWAGSWFHSGLGHIRVNATHIESKGKCMENQGDKYVMYESSEECYRCIVIHGKHANVLQYKESMMICEVSHGSLEELCSEIGGDAGLYSMFRSENAVPIPCPFKTPPYNFSYNRGSGECSVPQSRIDSCTDDSRLLLRYAACTDVLGTESSVEELVCLATWKDGSNRYLVGKLQSSVATTDEDRYRCFVYRHIQGGKEMVYDVAQSGDATCNGVPSATEGSKTMRLTRVETQHDRCKFPSWIVNHHHWHSLDYQHSYHFSHKNATLRITNDHGTVEIRLVCHSIESNSSHVALIAHATKGCESGYICMIFYRRDAHVIQLQQPPNMVAEPSEACNSGVYKMQYTSTLVTASLPAGKCPHSGRYAAKPPLPLASLGNVKRRSTVETSTSESERCIDQQSFNSVSIGCSNHEDTVEFLSACPDKPNTAFFCHGSWSENLTTYLIASPVNRKSTDPKHYCFVYVKTSATSPSNMILQRLSESCTGPYHRYAWTFNLTTAGHCIENSASLDSGYMLVPSVLSLVVAAFLINLLR